MQEAASSYGLNIKALTTLKDSVYNVAQYGQCNR